MHRPVTPGAYLIVRFCALPAAAALRSVMLADVQGVREDEGPDHPGAGGSPERWVAAAPRGAEHCVRLVQLDAASNIPGFPRPKNTKLGWCCRVHGIEHRTRNYPGAGFFNFGRTAISGERSQPPSVPRQPRALFQCSSLCMAAVFTYCYPCIGPRFDHRRGAIFFVLSPSGCSRARRYANPPTARQQGMGVRATACWNCYRGTAYGRLLAGLDRSGHQFNG